LIGGSSTTLNNRGGVVGGKETLLGGLALKTFPDGSSWESYYCGERDTTEIEGAKTWLTTLKNNGTAPKEVQGGESVGPKGIDRRTERWPGD